MTRRGFDGLLESAFRIRPDEQQRVGLMFLYSMTVVSAFIVGRTVRDTLFLSRYPIKRLPWMYVAVAVGVSLAALAYSRFADRHRRDRVIVASLSLSSAALTAVWLVLETRVVGAWIYPALYILIEIIGGISVIQFWTFANDIFSSREAKRLFSIVSAGGVMSNVICGFAISGAASLFGPEKLLVGCVMLYVVCISCVRGVARSARDELDAAVRRPKTRRGLTRDGGHFLQSKHLKLIAGIVAVTVLTITIVDYQFKVIARAAHEGREAELAAFFGYFFAFTGIVACFVQFFVTGRLLEKRGVVAALLVLPSALVFGAASVVLVVPIVSALAASTFTKGCENVFRYTLNDSTTQLLYVPVPSHQRGRAKAFIDGVLKPMCIGASGLIILGLTNMLPEEGFETRLSYLVLILLAAWLALVISIRSEYVRSLVNTLKSRRLDLAGAPAALNDETTAQALRTAFQSAHEAEVLHALELLPAVELDLTTALTPLLGHESPTVRITALRHLAQAGGLTNSSIISACFDDGVDEVRAAAVEAFCAVAGSRAIRTVEPFLTDACPVVRAAVVTGMIKHGGLDGILSAAESLKSLLNSDDSRVRVQGARVLESVSVSNFYQPVLRLLQDDAIDVQVAAIEAAGAMKSTALVPSLIYKLANRDTARAARRALIQFGPQVEAVLLKVLTNTREDRSIRLQVPKVLARVGSADCFDRLLRSIDVADIQLAARIAEAASKLRARIRHTDVDEELLIRSTTGALQSAYQALAIQLDIDIKQDELLAEAILLRHRKHLGLAFRLLSIRYPAGTIQLVYANLESDNKLVRANAVEVIDNVVSVEERRLILPLLDAHGTEAKVRTGSTLFDLERSSRAEWIERLLRDDDEWVVTCALDFVRRHNMISCVDQVAPHAGSENPVLRETACVTLGELVTAGAAADKTTEYARLARSAAEDDEPLVRRAGIALLGVVEPEPA